MKIFKVSNFYNVLPLESKNPLKLINIMKNTFREMFRDLVSAGS